MLSWNFLNPERRDILIYKKNELPLRQGNIEFKVHSGVEIARLIALIAVVSLHVNAYDIFGEDRTTGFVVDELSRFAVPLFFLVSGYLWKDNQLSAPAEPLLRLFRRLLIPFVIWVSFYTVCDVSQLFYPQMFPEPVGIRSYIFIMLDGGAGFHLWFLPALFMGTAIGWFGIRLAGFGDGVRLTAVLYLAGVAVALYARAMNFDSLLWTYRNGVFFAPIFLVLGHAMRKGWRPAIPLLILMALAGAALHLVEGWYVFDRFPKGHDMSLGTVPFAVGVFGLFLHVEVRAGALVSWGRDVFGAYLVHLFFLRLAAAYVPQRGVAAAVACIAMIVVVSLVVSRLMKANAITRVLVA